MKFIFTFMTITTVVAIFIIFIKEGILFEKNLKQQLKEKDDNYFEVRHTRSVRFLYILLSVVFSSPLFLGIFKDDPQNQSLEETILLIIISLILPVITICYNIYMMRIRIIFDHGKITLYSGNKIKITGTLDQIEKVTKPSTINRGHDYNSRIPYKIVFESGKRWIDFDYYMKNSYKLAAIFEKGNYFEKKKR